MAHDIISPHLIGFAPRTHHVGVVESKNCNDIHSFLAQVRQILDIAGHMVGRAGRSKSA